jgi:hypothetical protein
MGTRRKKSRNAFGIAGLVFAAVGVLLMPTRLAAVGFVLFVLGFLLNVDVWAEKTNPTN